MIGRLTGDVIERGVDGCCVLDIAGVGYEVFVPLRSVGRLPAKGATLHIHTHVREEAFTLKDPAMQEVQDKLVKSWLPSSRISATSCMKSPTNLMHII